jgi:hypothetical protein
LLRDITVARIFWLSQSEERKNSAKPKKWPSMIRNVSLVKGQTDRLALPLTQGISRLTKAYKLLRLEKQCNCRRNPPWPLL